MEKSLHEFKVSSYLLKFNTDQTGLFLEASQTNPDAKYTKQITNEMIKRLSDKAFSTCEVFEKALLNQLNKPASNTAIDIDQEGVFTYYTKYYIGSIENELKIKIELDLKEELSLESISRKLGKLNEKVTGIELNMDRHEQIIKKLETKLDNYIGANQKVIERIEKYFEQTQQKLDILLGGKSNKILNILPSYSDKQKLESEPNQSSKELHKFDPEGPFARFFSFSNNNRQVISNSAHYYSVYTEKPLNRDAKNSISILLGGFCDDISVVGIADKNDIKNPDAFAQPHTIRYRYTGTIHIYGDVNIVQTKFLFSEGAVVTFRCPSKSSLEIYFNKDLVHKMEISEKIEYYPFFYTQNNTDIMGTIVDYEL